MGLLQYPYQPYCMGLNSCQNLTNKKQIPCHSLAITVWFKNTLNTQMHFISRIQNAPDKQIHCIFLINYGFRNKLSSYTSYKYKKRNPISLNKICPTPQNIYLLQVQQNPIQFGFSMYISSMYLSHLNLSMQGTSKTAVNENVILARNRFSHTVDTLLFYQSNLFYFFKIHFGRWRGTWSKSLPGFGHHASLLCSVNELTFNSTLTDNLSSSHCKHGMFTDET